MNQRTKALRLLGSLLFALSLVGCDHKGSSYSTPTFFEREINDDAFSANDFGVLYPGDRFYIDGFIAADGSDPFDGFRFLAGEPIHVDFRLFIDDAFTDLDICLFDPFLDRTLDCWETLDDPERGGVDVFGGGFEFHLVVEAFSGSSSYSLEIDVSPLYLSEATAAGALAQEDAPEATGLNAVGGSGSASDVVSAGGPKGSAMDRFGAYSERAEPPRSRTTVTLGPEGSVRTEVTHE